MYRYLNVTIGEKEFDEIKQGKVKILCLPCIPRWCHTLYQSRECKLNCVKLQ